MTELAAESHRAVRTRTGLMLRYTERNPMMVAGGVILVLLVLVALLAPWLRTVDPLDLEPAIRLMPPSAEHWFGTDMYGRDSYSRVIYGSRISLIVGASVALITSVVGLLLGLLSGYLRTLDGVIMRIMDGIMALPSLLLALSFVALANASVQNVIVALTIPQAPRVARLVRGVVLSLREEAYVEASVALGTRLWRILLRHILPNAMAPLIVQATFICAGAILTEAGLSFLGVGTPPDIPSWGNIMAESGPYVGVAFWLITFPGLFLAVTVLAVNLLGDGLRDTLDPRLTRRE